MDTSQMLFRNLLIILIRYVGVALERSLLLCLEGFVWWEKHFEWWLITSLSTTLLNNTMFPLVQTPAKCPEILAKWRMLLFCWNERLLTPIKGQFKVILKVLFDISPVSEYRLRLIIWSNWALIMFHLRNQIIQTPVSSIHGGKGVKIFSCLYL